MTHRCLLLGVWVAVSLLTGCGYTLRGKVVDGASSHVQVVDQDDPRLGHLGVAGASVQLTIDPQSLGRKSLPPRPIADDGTFAIPIDELGAGLLEYDVEVVVRAQGYDSAVHTLRLPGGDKRLLVTLAAGPDRFQPREDLRRQAEQLLRE